MGQDGNIAAHLSLLGAAGIWGGVFHNFIATMAIA